MEELLKRLWHQWVLSIDAAGSVKFKLFTYDCILMTLAFQF